MNDLHPIPAPPQPTDHKESVPFAQQVVVLTKQEHIQLVWNANYWESLHQLALAREADLKKQLAFEQARVRDLTQRLYGKQSEKTGWKVFEQIADKLGYRWYLWLMQSPSLVYYIMEPGRSADVSIAHFSGLKEDITEVFLTCDRYSAYKKLVKNIPVILLAFC